MVATEVRTMDRTLGLRSSVSFMVGIVIGSGIFASPGFVLADVKSPGAALIVWSFCGLLTLAGSLSMAELSAALPLSGGESVYLTRAFHPLVGFWYTWVTGTLAKPCGEALIAIVFSDYVCRLFTRCEFNTEVPGADGEVLCGIALDEWIEKGIALGAVWFLASLQILSTSAATATQQFFTAEKLLLVGTICVLGVVEASTEADRFRNTTVALSPGRAFENTEDDATDWALAVTNCLFAYNGWNNLNLSAGEVKNAGVTIPQATMISIPLITVCYIWVNASYMLALPTEAISSGKTIAVDFAREIGGTVAGDAMAVAVACSAFGALNGSIFGAARLLHACGTDGTLPRIFGTTVSFCRAPTPLVATVVQATIASILIAAIGSFTVIVKIYIFAQWFFYLVTMIGLLRLRVTEPMLHRPFKVLLPVPVAFIVAASFVVGVLLWQSPSECGIGLAVLLAGTPVYFLQRDPKATLQGQFDGHLVAEAAPLLSGVSKRTDADPDDYYDGAESGRSTPAAAGTTSIWASCCFWFAASDLNAGSSAGEAGEAAGGNLYRPDAEFDSDGVKIRYFDTGTGSLGETAMLIHGWSSSSRMWMESAPFTVRIVGPLVDAGFRVIGMDIRGHGLSDKPRNVSDYGLNMVEDHVRFLDHLGIAGAVHVAGAAMGAEIAIKLATMHPGLVKSLCPVGTGWSAGTDWFEKSYGYMTNPCTSEGFCLATACGYHTCCCPCAMQMMLGEVPDRRAVLAAGRSMESVIDVDESDLRALRVPVHGIVGEKDEERRYVERMRGVVPDFTMAIIPGKGHDASFTDPLWHSETVDFFKRVVVLPRRKRGNSTVSQSGGSQSEQPE